MVAQAQVDLILAVERWPLHPILPLEHQREKDGQFPKLGVMIACDGYELTVFHCCMYDLKKVKDALEYPRVTYNSLDELKNDWRVC